MTRPLDDPNIFDPTYRELGTADERAKVREHIADHATDVEEERMLLAMVLGGAA